MATPVTMPQMGYDMTEGSIQNWVKKEGDKVEKGETLAEIETDKATVDMEAYASGILKKIIVAPGQLVPVGTVIAVIADENEVVDWKALGVDGGGASAPAAPAVAPTATAVAPAATAPASTLAPAPAASATPAPIAQVTPAPTPPEKKPTTGRPSAASLINLAAPISAAGGPGGAPVPAETSAELQSAATVSAPVSEALAVAPPALAAAVSNGVAVAPAPAATGESNGRIKSSPLARKVAGELGVDLSAVTGSGPGGRILRPDVESFASSAPAAVATPIPAPIAATTSAPAPSSAAATTIPGTEYDEVTLSRMRQTIARRLTESKQQIPHIYITNEIDMSAALKLRQQLNTSLAESGEGGKISVNDMVVKAVAKALRKVPMVNNSYVDGKLRVNHRVNVAVAVAVDEGLITPVVFDTDQKSMGQIAREVKALAEKAHAGKLRPEEYQGGTFSISNLGMYDVSSFVAIINPPQSAILAIGSSKPTVVPKGDSLTEFEIIQQMSVTISADHRVIDGAVAAQFLQELKKLLQNPMLLVI